MWSDNQSSRTRYYRVYSHGHSHEKHPLLSKHRTKEANPKQNQHFYSKCLGAVILIIVMICFYHVNPFQNLWPTPKERDPMLSAFPVNILIIGAGPAGVSAAWSIYQEAKKHKVNARITMIEQKPSVGGRLQITNPLDDNSQWNPIHMEDVATGYLWDKKFLRQARENFDIEPCTGTQYASDLWFWNGERFVEKMRKPLEELSWFTWFKLTFKYGRYWYRNIQKLKSLGRLDEGYSTKTAVDGVAKLLQSFELSALVDTNAYNYINENSGISKRYIHDVLEPQLRRQLGGQNLADLSLLAVSRALNIEDVKKCSGGGIFQKILENYLSKSNVDLKLNSKVIGLEPVLQGNKSIWIAHHTSFDNKTQRNYFDHIIATGPLNLTDLSRDTNFKQEQGIYYQSTWVTHFVSDSCVTHSRALIPNEIVPVHDSDTKSELQDINEISLIQNFGPENENSEVEPIGCLYQTLSKTQITDLTLSYAAKYGFSKLRDFEIEKAYPLLYPRRVEYGNFKVQDGLWHTGVVEAASNEVPLSWAAGEIVGRLILTSEQTV